MAIWSSVTLGRAGAHGRTPPSRSNALRILDRRFVRRQAKGKAATIFQKRHFARLCALGADPARSEAARQ